MVQSNKDVAKISKQATTALPNVESKISAATKNNCVSNGDQKVSFGNTEIRQINDEIAVVDDEILKKRADFMKKMQKSSKPIVYVICYYEFF